MKRLDISTILSVWVLIILIIGGCAEIERPRPREKSVRMVAGPEGGSWYPLGNAMMKIVAENIPGISTYNTSGGGVGNCKAIQRGDADIGWTFTHHSYNAYNGRGELFKKKHGKLRHVMSLYPGVFQIAVPRSSDIKTIADLADKRIVPGKVGFFGEFITRIVLKAYGITYKSIKKNGGSVSFIGHLDAAALMKDGRIDAFMAITSCPMGIFIDLNFRPGIRFIAIDIEKVLGIEPGLMPTVIPKTAYKGLTEDVPTVGAVTQIIASADLSDDTVYQIVKALYANWDELKKAKKKAIEASLPENALLGVGIPVHPGAMRYYKEKGITPK